MKRFTFFLIFIIFAAFIGFYLTPKIAKADVTKLKPGKPIEKEMRGSEVHVYLVSLKSDQFMFATVEQHGIDVVVKIFSPNDEQIDEIDAPTGDRGSEYISLVTKTSGDYRIEIHPFDAKAKPGKYRINIEKIEKAATDPSGKIDQLFAVWDKKGFPGAAVAVVKDGEIVFKRGYGSANLEYDIPITPSTVFHIASVSKQFTAFAIATLAQQGKLSLDDDIRKYLPEVPDFGKKITIRHLIHHTSGLRDQWNLLVMAGWRLDDVITKEHILKLVQNQEELNFEPGAEYLYCNTGYTLMAEIVERVTGKPLPEWAEENIFKPIGMDNTLFYDDHEKIVKNRAYSYKIGSTNNFKKSVLNYANVGATSLFTTAEDLSYWALNFENPKVGSSELFKKMEERGIVNSGDNLVYAFGQGVGKYKGLKLIGHGGGDAGYRSYLGRFPEQRFAVVILSNLASFNTYGMAMKIADIYLADQIVEEKLKEATTEKNDEVTIDTAILKDYVGSYELMPGFVITISLEADRLMGQATGQPKVRLYPESETKFFIKEADAQISFQRDETRKVTQLALHQGGQDRIAKRVKPFTLNWDQLDELTGDYYSDELGTTYSIVVNDSNLVVHHRRHEDFKLNPVSRDLFNGSVWFFGQVKFERDSDYNIIGCRVSNGRVRNLIFERQSKEY